MALDIFHVLLEINQFYIQNLNRWRLTYFIYCKMLIDGAWHNEITLLRLTTVTEQIVFYMKLNFIYGRSNESTAVGILRP